MEISGSTVTGAMRVGLQIISAYRRPHLEIYYEVLNQYGPEYEYRVPNWSSGPPDVQRSRSQDVQIQFRIVNIGGQRAEQINLAHSGGFKRGSQRDFGGLFEGPVPQMAPGQVLQLFLLDQHEVDGLDADSAAEELIIVATYNSPGGILNFAKTFFRRILRKPHHRTEFRFSPRLVWGDLPPAHYA